MHHLKNQEVKNNGKHGHKIWMTGLTSILKLLKLEFHINQHSNLIPKLILINFLWLVKKDQDFLHIQATMHHLKSQEGKNNGKHGPKTWTTGQTNKQKPLKLEFHTNQPSLNLKTIFHPIMNWLILEMMTSMRPLNKKKNPKTKKMFNKKKMSTLTLKILKMKNQMILKVNKKLAMTMKSKSLKC